MAAVHSVANPGTSQQYISTRMILCASEMSCVNWTPFSLDDGPLENNDTYEVYPNTRAMIKAGWRFVPDVKRSSDDDKFICPDCAEFRGVFDLPCGVTVSPELYHDVLIQFGVDLNELSEENNVIEGMWKGTLYSIRFDGNTIDIDSM